LIITGSEDIDEGEEADEEAEEGEEEDSKTTGSNFISFCKFSERISEEIGMVVTCLRHSMKPEERKVLRREIACLKVVPAGREEEKEDDDEEEDGEEVMAEEEEGICPKVIGNGL
jgi:hypothetical protein